MSDTDPIDLADLDRAIARLRPFEREVFFLHRLDDLPYDVIGTRMGITTAEVERIMGRVLDQLRRRLARRRRALPLCFGRRRR
jgi:RNA polymerase sigma factor (sigma-70 family)